VIKHLLLIAMAITAAAGCSASTDVKRQLEASNKHFREIVQRQSATIEDLCDRMREARSTLESVKSDRDFWQSKSEQWRTVSEKLSERPASCGCLPGSCCNQARADACNLRSAITALHSDVAELCREWQKFNAPPAFVCPLDPPKMLIQPKRPAPPAPPKPPAAAPRCVPRLGGPC
jgi:hypothetical protein